MNQIKVGSRIVYQVHAPTTFLFNISVARNEHQQIVEELFEVEPFFKIEECAVSPLGNRLVRLSVSPCDLTVSYNATVNLNVEEAQATDVSETPYEQLPADILPYLNPSRYCESDKLLEFATKQFGSLVPDYSRVTAICNWVYEELSYTAGSTGPTTTACDVLELKQGVCRDFAHVSISLCRALGIPARYVAGYAVNLNPPDFHGFFEAYLDGRWFLFDATRLAPVGGFVRIGTGRDAADVAFSTIRGDAESPEMQVWAKEEHSDDKLLDPDNVETAVSSAP
ncbi:transglutaminase family protein [Allohahella marinimesophila]|uniref:Transglutaminase family protein n=1 Tax=Allohahella marinimesophila TaxID=1054972 RepID=A0ABP7NYA3_9GAMM